MFEFLLKYYQISVVVAVALLLIVWEWGFPSRAVIRKPQFLTDVYGALIATVAFTGAELGLMNFFGSDADLSSTWAWLSWIRALPSAAKIAGAMLSIDFCIYWIHRGMHASSLLWRAHRWHHSTQSLYWFSGIRTSVTQALIEAVPQVFIPFCLFRASPTEAFFGYAILVFLNFWIHANVSGPRGLLGWIFVGPDLHRQHHSARGADQNANFGTFFTFWDRLFKTYAPPVDAPASFPLGIELEGRSPSKTKLTRWSIGV